MGPETERELLDAAFERLRHIVADDGGMELRPYPAEVPDTGKDAVWELAAPNHTSPLLVEAFRRFMPRDVDRVLGGVSPLMRRILYDPPIVVVAPWLSARSRQVLTDRGLNYVDLTGNVRLSVARPKIFVRLDGAQHDPNPPAKPPVRLQGASINALVRLLVDVEPPYKLVELARATGLSAGYVSRALEALDEDRLVERHPRSRIVVTVDWQALLRARVEHYGLLQSNRFQTYIARAGARALYERLATTRNDQALVTGSFAASEYVQLAAPAQLALYAPNIRQFGRSHELIPAGQGADVVLLQAADQSQLDRVRQVHDGAFHVGLSQLVLDCLGGNGRLPEEGEALLEWMASDTAAWRLPHLPQVASPRR